MSNFLAFDCFIRGKIATLLLLKRMISVFVVSRTTSETSNYTSSFIVKFVFSDNYICSKTSSTVFWRSSLSRWRYPFKNPNEAENSRSAWECSEILPVYRGSSRSWRKYTPQAAVNSRDNIKVKPWQRNYIKGTKFNLMGTEWHCGISVVKLKMHWTFQRW